jgi:hypothetical protein
MGSSLVRHLLVLVAGPAVPYHGPAALESEFHLKDNRDAKRRTMLIGIDLDNTLICYESLFQCLAVEAGLVEPSAPGTRESIRAAARRSPEGDIAWQKLQGLAYGPRIGEARPAEGALVFLAACARLGIPVRVISHKNEWAAQDPSRTHLRRAALDWLEARGFFSDGLLLPGHCRFGATRREKIAHIVAEGCTHFIDDLPETFLDPGFPAGVAGILYAPGGAPPAVPPGVRPLASWAAITDLLLPGGAGPGGLP